MDVQSLGSRPERVVAADVPRSLSADRRWWRLALAAVVVVATGLKLSTTTIGGPQFMIDDFTLFDGGFLVWFGQAPPQHAFIESWICGVVMHAYFGLSKALEGQWGVFGLNFVPTALREYYNAPDTFYHAYRLVLVAVDLLTALIVFRLARRVLRDDGWWSALVTALFLLSANALWCTLIGRPDTLTTACAALGLYLVSRK